MAACCWWLICCRCSLQIAHRCRVPVSRRSIIVQNIQKLGKHIRKIPVVCLTRNRIALQVPNAHNLIQGVKIRIPSARGINHPNDLVLVVHKRAS